MCVISLSGYDVIVYITLSTILYMDQKSFLKKGGIEHYLKVIELDHHRMMTKTF